MGITAQKSIYNDDFYLTETFIYKVESEVYEKMIAKSLMIARMTA